MLITEKYLTYKFVLIEHAGKEKFYNILTFFLIKININL